MDRTYTRRDISPGVLSSRLDSRSAMTTDIIVGFPGESEEDFLETSALCATFADGCFAFKFSPRAGTPAADFPDQIPESVRVARLAKVLLLQDEISLEKNRAWIGRQVEVLVDRELSKRNSGLAAGRTRQNKIVHFGGGTVEEGTLVNLKITEATPHHLRESLLLPRNSRQIH
jgi:tRNA-2-methylthio-N6-dimethylallyladenosine synthase